MIKYEDIIKRIANIEKKKIKNEERIKALSDENNILTANLKLLNQKKEMHLFLHILKKMHWILV